MTPDVHPALARVFGCCDPRSGAKRRRGQRNSTSVDVVEVVRQLVFIDKDVLIAVLLNRNGLKTGNGNRWTRERVTSMRSNYRIPVSKPAQDRIGPRLKPRQRRTAPEDRDEDALAEDGAIESIPLRPMVLGSWPAPLTPCLPPNPSPNARLNPKYPAGSHPSQQNLLSSIT